MKKIFTIAALICASFTMNAQKLITIISNSDTNTSVMEDKIWRIDNTTDSTSLVYYVNWQGYTPKIASDTNEAKYVAIGTRFITPSGLGYTINADNILEVTRLTENSCFIRYKEGNSINKIVLSISVGELNTLINSL